MSDLNFDLDGFYMPSGLPSTTSATPQPHTNAPIAAPPPPHPHQHQPPQQQHDAFPQDDDIDEPEDYSGEVYGVQGGAEELDLTEDDDGEDDSATARPSKPPPLDQFKGEELSLNDVFSQEELRESPEQIVVSQINNKILQPFLVQLTSVLGPHIDDIRGEVIIDDEGEVYEDPNVINEKIGELRAVSTHNLTHKYCDISSIYISPQPPDIPVTVEGKKYEKYFYQDTPIDSDVRLSAEYLKSIPREKVLFAAAPVGFQNGRKYDLATRYGMVVALSTSVIESTLKAYGGVVIQLMNFFDKTGAPAGERFPVHQTDLMLFLSTFVGNLATSTIRKKYDAVLMWHVFHSQPFNIDKRALRTIYHSAENNYSKEKKDKRPGIKITNLIWAVKQFKTRIIDKPEEKGFLLACIAAGLVALIGMPRLGELTTKKNGQNLKDGEKLSDIFNPMVNVNGNNVEYLISGEIEILKIHIPYTKREKTKGEDIFVASQKAVDIDACPVEAFKEHYTFNRISGTVPLFSYVDRDGRRKFMTTNGLVEAYNKEFTTDGHPEISGHSFRIGGHGFFEAASVHPDRIRQIGRWKSNAVDAYVRTQAETAARNMANILFDQDDEIRRGDIAEWYGDEVEEDDTAVELAEEGDAEASQTLHHPPTPSIVITEAT